MLSVLLGAAFGISTYTPSVLGAYCTLVCTTETETCADWTRGFALRYLTFSCGNGVCAAGMQMVCYDSTRTAVVGEAVGTMQSDVLCPTGSLMCGMEVRYEDCPPTPCSKGGFPPTFAVDCVAAASFRVQCCLKTTGAATGGVVQLEGSGGNGVGTWRGMSMCPAKQFIYSADVQHSSNIGIVTAPRPPSSPWPFTPIPPVLSDAPVPERSPTPTSTPPLVPLPAPPMPPRSFVRGCAPACRPPHPRWWWRRRRRARSWTSSASR